MKTKTSLILNIQLQFSEIEKDIIEEAIISYFGAEFFIMNGNEKWRILFCEKHKDTDLYFDLQEIKLYLYEPINALYAIIKQCLLFPNLEISENKKALIISLCENIYANILIAENLTQKYFFTLA